MLLIEIWIIWCNCHRAFHISLQPVTAQSSTQARPRQPIQAVGSGIKLCCNKLSPPQVRELSRSRLAHISKMPPVERAVMFQKPPDAPKKHSTQCLYVQGPTIKCGTQCIKQKIFTPNPQPARRNTLTAYCHSSWLSQKQPVFLTAISEAGGILYVLSLIHI